MSDQQKDERSEPKAKGYQWKSRRATAEELQALRGKTSEKVNAYLESNNFLEVEP